MFRLWPVGLVLTLLAFALAGATVYAQLGDRQTAGGVINAASVEEPTPTPTPTPTGDVNCDGLVNVVEALFVLQFEVGLRVDSGGCPLPPPLPHTLNVAACDVSDDGLCNVVDALFILQCEVGIPNALCPAP